MKSEAIRCAIKLHAEPKLLARFNDPFRKLPRGVTELLRLVSSDGALKKISSINHLDANRFKEILLSYIQTVLLQNNNSDLRKLGLTKSADKTQCKLHYKLLMNIFHPDKINGDANQHHYTQIISQAYKNIKRSQQDTIVTKKCPPNTRVENNDSQLASLDKPFKQKRKTSVIKKHLIKPIISLFLIVIFTAVFFFISSSSPQIVVKKQTDFNVISKN